MKIKTKTGETVEAIRRMAESNPSKGEQRRLARLVNPNGTREKEAIQMEKSTSPSREVTAVIGVRS